MWHAGDRGGAIHSACQWRQYRSRQKNPGREKFAAAVTADRADALLAIDDRVHALVRAHIGVKCRTFGHILHNIHSDQARLLVIGPAGC